MCDVIVQLKRNYFPLFVVSSTDQKDVAAISAGGAVCGVSLVTDIDAARPGL